MTKDFSRFAPKEMESLPLIMSEFAAKIDEARILWKTAAIVFGILFLLTAFHNYVLPHLI